MPIVQPGTGKLSFTVEAIKPLKGVMKVDLNILRTVSGIKLPIRCYKVQNEDVGSWLVLNFDYIIISYTLLLFIVHILICVV